MRIRACRVAAVMPLAALVLGGCIHLAPVDPEMPERCALHDVETERELVPIRYGLIPPPPGYHDSKARRFPNAKSWVWGGCMVGDPRWWALVEACPICNEVEEAWWDEHRDDPYVVPDPGDEPRSEPGSEEGLADVSEAGLLAAESD